MNRPPRVRRLAAALAAGVVVPSVALIATTAAPAHAVDAPTPVTQAQFRWGLNNESNNAAFAPGTFNLFSAGKIGNPGAGGATLKGADEGATWSTGATAGWKSAAGNVVIEKKQADGSYAPTTWAGTKTDPNGAAVTVNSSTFTDQQVVINNGVGTLDAAADDADITWDGDFTALYYSGMTYFTVSDPHLVVDDGIGTVTATLGGYATDMNDTTKWNPLPDTTVTLASLTGVDVTDAGLSVTPDYLGVGYTAPSNATPQSAPGSANYGSFPQSFVDFQQLTGSSSYWYSSGGAADARKATLPLQVKVAAPSVSVSSVAVSPTGSTTVTVTGKGFNPAVATGTRPPLAGKAAGTYIAFGKYADVWRPSAGAPSSSRKNGATGTAVKWAVPEESFATVGGADAGAVVLNTDGSFTASITIDKAALDAIATDPSLTNYGIYTYPASGATQAAYETYTPISFPSVTVSKTMLSATDTATVTVTGTGFTPSAATGTRPPLAGKAAGTYIAFGKYADVWRPSAGAAAAARKNAPGTAVKWAVPAESITTIGGAAAGAVELSADGSFTAEITVDKAALDAIATDPSLTNYGIYTYAGSGASQAGYETYTPISFPTVTVSQTMLPDSRASTVTVTGTGFTPSAATGTRPPLAGKAAGTYIAFGKYAETWRPSAGAPSSSRTNGATGTAVKWAVPAESFTTVGGADAGAVELSADGSFTAEITVDKAALDAIATDPSLVNYGIYTYPGSGATQAAYETYTPITFEARPVPTLTLSAPEAIFGTAAVLTATVPDATGDVTLTGAGDAITAPLVDGVATFTLPATLPAGSYDLSAAYAGDTENAPATGTGALTIEKATPTLTIDGPTTVVAGTAITLTAHLAGATGDVILTGTGDPITRPLADGVVTFDVPSTLVVGGHTLTVTYAGDDNHVSVTGTHELVVNQPPSSGQGDQPAPVVKLTPSQQKVANAQAKVAKTTTAIARAKAAAKAAKKAHHKAQATKLAKKIAKLKKQLTKQKKALTKAKAAAKKASKKRN